MEWKLKQRTALLIVDVQQDFCSAEGQMGQYGVDLSMIDAAADQMERLINKAHEHHVPVIFIFLSTQPATDSRAMKRWYARQGMDGEQAVALCRQGSFGAEPYRLAPAEQDYVVTKQRYSAFVGTNLELLLQQLQVETLIVAGVTTECCVDSTVRDGFMKDYEVVVVENACAAYEQDVHQAALKILELNFATIMHTDEVISNWNGV